MAEEQEITAFHNWLFDQKIPCTVRGCPHGRIMGPVCNYAGQCRGSVDLAREAWLARGDKGI